MLVLTSNFVHFSGGTTSIARLPAPSAVASFDSPLHEAARQGDTATICRLIEEQHSPNSLENDGSTPVHVAAETGQLGRAFMVDYKLLVYRCSHMWIIIEDQHTIIWKRGVNMVQRTGRLNGLCSRAYCTITYR